MEDYNYHQRLNKLNTYSLERRRERYQILYVFKILLQKVPNVGINFKITGRRGRMIVPPAIRKNSSAHALTLRSNSFRNKVSRLFNHLPSDLRNVHTNVSLDVTKRMLDNYLSSTKDEPNLPG